MTNIGLELSLKTQRRKTSAQKTPIVVAQINCNGENIFFKKTNKHKMAFTINSFTYDANIDIARKKTKENNGKEYRQLFCYS